MPPVSPISVYRALRRAGVGRARIAASVVSALVSREARGVHSLLLLHERTLPGRAAVVEREKRIGFAALAWRVRRIAGALGARGVGPGVRAVVCLPNGIDMVAILGAVRTLGAQAVPTSPHYKREELRHVLADSGAVAFCYGAGIREEARAAIALVGGPGGIAGGVPPRPGGIAGGGGPPPQGRLRADAIVEVASDAAPALRPEGGATLEDLLLGPDIPLPPDVRNEPDQPAILYTSGTTGLPKGARPTVPDAIGIVERLASLFRLRSAETILVPAPLYHAAPAMMCQIALLLGATLVLPARFDAEDALRTIERERVTFAYFVPFMIEQILRLPEEARRRWDRSSLRGVVSAAAWLRPEARVGACDLFGDIVFEFYGSTETGVATFLHPEEQRAKSASVGRPIGGVALRIEREDGREAAKGEVGEILVKSRWLRTEYVGRPAETAAAHRGGFFASGDLGFLDEDGFLHLAGRAKDMVNSAGVKVFPAEVEREVAQHPDVADMAVFPVTDARWGEAAWAAVVRAPGATLDEAGLIAWTKGRMAGFKAPKRVIFVDELPRNPAGKVLKRVLRERCERP